MKNMFTKSPYIAMLANMLGMERPTPLPAHLPFVPYAADTGTRRKTKTRVNRAAWKCNEKRPMSDETRGHLYDIDYCFTTEAGERRAFVICRRCKHSESIAVKTKQYTQNKKVLAARAKAA